MLISASRRTDIPAFYARWFMQRVREGWCEVPNPFDRRRCTRLSLRPEDVTAIAFWTRNPRPLFGDLEELDRRGFRYWFQVSLLGYPRAIDPRSPSVPVATRTLRELAERLGPDRVVWRYDPIVLGRGDGITVDDHRRRFVRLAESLRGATRRVVISFVDRYRKNAARLRRLADAGLEIDDAPENRGDFAAFVADLAAIARANDMAIQSCAEQRGLEPFGVAPGRCLDPELVARTLGVVMDEPKDPNQRAACGCVTSRDIGVYDTCPYGCAYCYANRGEELALRNRALHLPAAPALLHAAPPTRT